MGRYLPASRFVIERSVLVDIVDSRRRSEMMAGIKGRNTGPEFVFRQIAYRLGLRLRLHRKDLLGLPDLVLPRRGLTVFVHGCFWHQHDGCDLLSRGADETDMPLRRVASGSRPIWCIISE